MAAIGTGWADGAWIFEGWAVGAWATGASAAITGTAGDGATESEIVNGGQTIVITLSDDTFNAFNDTIRQAIIDGLDSAQSEANGWNAEVRDKEVVGAVVRDSDTQVTITLTAASGYSVTADETITVTIPASALAGGSEVTASPTFDVTNEVDEELIQQEFFCSFDAPLQGSFWGDQLIDAEKDKRITRVPHDESLPVHTWWDLGNADATAVWFVQIAGAEIHVIDYDEGSFRTPAQDVSMLHRKRDEHGYNYGRHVWPHDGGHRTKASGGRALSALYGDLGIYPEVQPRYDVQVAITRVRQILPRCWFDETKCAAGLDALRAFRKQLDEERSSEARPYYKPGYVHDWSSHGSSAFYTGAMVAFTPTTPSGRDRYSGEGRKRKSAWAA